jgi:hypothetical protein
MRCRIEHSPEIRVLDGQFLDIIAIWLFVHDVVHYSKSWQKILRNKKPARGSRPRKQTSFILHWILPVHPGDVLTQSIQTHAFAPAIYIRRIANRPWNMSAVNLIELRSVNLGKTEAQSDSIFQVGDVAKFDFWWTFSPHVQQARMLEVPIQISVLCQEPSSVRSPLTNL